MSLTNHERQLLAFEERWWKYQGAKEQAIKDELGVTAARYYQELHELIERPAALEAHPMLVKRLRRLRDTRQQHRSARQLGL